MEQEKYHLYVTEAKNAPKDEKFCFVTPDYCVIYTPKELSKEQYIEVTDLSRLSQSEWKWLSESVHIVQAEYEREHRDEILKQAKDFKERFHQSLEEENRKLANQPVRIPIRVKKKVDTYGQQTT